MNVLFDLNAVYYVPSIDICHLLLRSLQQMHSDYDKYIENRNFIHEEKTDQGRICRLKEIGPKNENIRTKSGHKRKEVEYIMAKNKNFIEIV
jgi:hypothetical protein